MAAVALPPPRNPARGRLAAPSAAPRRGRTSTRGTGTAASRDGPRLRRQRASVAAHVEARGARRRCRARRARGRRRRVLRRSSRAPRPGRRARRTASSGGRRLPARRPAPPGQRTSSTGRSAPAPRLPCRERSRSHRAITSLHQRPDAVAREAEPDRGQQHGAERRLREAEVARRRARAFSGSYVQADSTRKPPISAKTTARLAYPAFPARSRCAPLPGSSVRCAARPGDACERRRRVTQQPPR